jgi:hypothetical protein
MGDVLAIDQDGARGRILQTRDHPHRGGLAAARGAEKHQKLAIRDGQVEIIDANERPPTLAHVAQNDLRHGQSPVSDRSSVVPRIFCIRLQKA